MRRILLFFYIFMMLAILPGQEIKINEVLYDSEGSDSGNEWIEIYNNSTETVDLSGWKILKAGTEFTEVFTFPEYSIDPLSFVIIGEENIQFADFTTDLAFQNGGSATDGIRLISVDGIYTDTVLYDSPNTNQLTDDNGNIAEFFAPDVSSGFSLARIVDGMDTNDCNADFFACEYLTPGNSNLYPIDLAISEAIIVETLTGHQLLTAIQNLSSIDVDNSEAHLEIAVNSDFWGVIDLPFLPAGSIIDFEVNLGEFLEGYVIIQVNLNYINDLELNNNVVSMSVLNGFPPVVINEIMFKPANNAVEWLEIYNLSNCGCNVDNFRIIDASNGEIIFQGFIDPGQYLVITEDVESFQNSYPDIPSSIIIEADSWTPLNNGEEELILQDSLSTIFESLCYQGGNISTGYSLERINPNLPPEIDNWGESIDGATPGSRNSIFIDFMPVDARLYIQPNPFSPYNGEHTIISFDLPETLSMVTLKIFDLKGRLIKTLADQDMQTPIGEFIWDGKSNNGKRLTTGVYIILMQATGQENEKVYELTRTIVIAV